MGMFDSIIFKMNCPNCKKKVSRFQSKDGPCDLENLQYWEVDNFHAYCGGYEGCGALIEFYRDQMKPFVPIQHFKCIMSIKNKGRGQDVKELDINDLEIDT